jgi:NADP-dependent 3-hydroxy acid dehydrogenase YdfG
MAPMPALTRLPLPPTRPASNGSSTVPPTASTQAAPGIAATPGSRAAPSAGGEEWLRVLGAAQEQAAAAHADFQRALTDSHLAYLQMAEATFAQLLAATTGEAPPSPVQAPARPVPLPQAPGYRQVPEPSGYQQVPEPPRYPGPPAPAAAPPGPAAVPVPASPGGSAGTRATSPEPGSWDVESVSALLLEVVAERTGYPLDMLSVDMEIDTDLGIDSIKKVEILSAVRERIGDVPGDLGALATLRTLRAIAEEYAPPVAAPTAVADDGQQAAVSRWAPRAVPAPLSGLAMPGLAAGPLAVTDDGAGVAEELVAQLARHGIRAQVVADPPPGARGLIALDGLRTVTAPHEAESAQRRLFGLARQLAAQMTAEGGIFVTVQDTGGDFGLSGHGLGTSPMRGWLGGCAALARTAAREWPRATVKAIDCATAGRSPAEIASALVAELAGGSGPLDVGLAADGTRVTLAPEPAPPGPGAPRVGPWSVIVASGGARGVTAAGLRLLASKHRPRLVLLGRTPLDAEPAGLSAATSRPELIRLLASGANGTPAEIAAAADRVLAAREIRQTLAAIEQSGAPVRYHAVDVTDQQALADVLAAVRSDWGPITGVVHGAGVLADALIAGKTDEQFDRVFAAKVTGLQALLTATADDPLEILCAFSSVAAQFGNPGQCDYAMANEVLNQVLSAEQARRPRCLVRAIGWGPWQGGMVTGEIAGRFRDAGVALIDQDAGAAAFVAELGDPAGPARVIVSAGALPPAVATAPGPTAMAGQVTVAGPDYAYLLDHQVGDEPVAAVATVLDWFTGAARAWLPGASSVTIHDLRVLSKLALPRLAADGHLLTVRGQQVPSRPDGPLELDLLGDNGQRHYRASAVGAAPPAAAWDGPAGLVPLPSPYDGVTLFHGPRLQVIRDAPEVGPAGAMGIVTASRAAGWERQSWQLDPAAVDGALQLAVLWALHAGAGSTLPMGIRECRAHRPGTAEEEFRCVVLAGRLADSWASCDVVLTGSGGAPWLELLGVELVRRPG